MKKATDELPIVGDPSIACVRAALQILSANKFEIVLLGEGLLPHAFVPLFAMSGEVTNALAVTPQFIAEDELPEWANNKPQILAVCGNPDQYQDRLIRAASIAVQILQK